MAKVGTSKGGEKQWQTIPKNLPRMQCAKSHIGSITGLWFLPDRPLGLNTNELIYIYNIYGSFKECGQTGGRRSKICSILY